MTENNENMNFENLDRPIEQENIIPETIVERNEAAVPPVAVEETFVLEQSENSEQTVCDCTQPCFEQTEEAEGDTAEQTQAEDNTECEFDPFQNGGQFAGNGAPFYTIPNVAPDPKGKNGKKGIKIVATVLAAVMLCLSGMFVGYYSANYFGNNKNKLPFVIESSNSINSPSENDGGSGSGSTSSFDITIDNTDGSILTTEQAVAKVSPSVVNITIYSVEDKTGGYASGIIMSKDGYILTNDHIYAEVANAKFLITLHDGTEYHAKFVSGDTRRDIAILKITDQVDNLPVATFGHSSDLVVGEDVIAIGQSSGLESTVTSGIVSALNRRIRSSNTAYSERHIQTTAAINPGNSGGALVNLKGQVVGVTSSKYVNEGVEGICFAIPIDDALDVVDELKKYGKVESRVRLGITYNTMGTAHAEINNMPAGLYIAKVDQSSDLYGKGYGEGDIITHINGEKVTSDHKVLDIIEKSDIKTVLTLTIYDSSEKKSTDVKIGLIKAESSNSYSTQSEKETAPESSSDNVFDIIPNPYE